MNNLAPDIADDGPDENIDDELLNEFEGVRLSSQSESSTQGDGHVYVVDIIGKRVQKFAVN
jgi:hypothetical protein